jgi:6-phosphogluconolactonase
MSGRILYVSCAERHEIFILSLDLASGALSKLGVAIAAGEEGMGTSMAMAVSPNRRVLYAAVRTPPMPLSCFAIDAATGSLKLLGAAPLPDQMAYIVTDHTGRHLLGASYHGSQIASSPIGEDGVVRTPATQVMDTPPKAHSILPDPANRFLFAASLGGNVVLRLRFDAETGRFDPLSPVRVHEGAGPRHLRFSPMVASSISSTSSTAPSSPMPTTPPLAHSRRSRPSPPCLRARGSRAAPPQPIFI